jgi:hypothetical protein
VLRIRKVYLGSRIRKFFIPDPGSQIRKKFIADPEGKNRDAPDIPLIQKPGPGYPDKAGYRISGRIFVLKNIFLVKY